jgi:hypothetical protein
VSYKTGVGKQTVRYVLERYKTPQKNTYQGYLLGKFFDRQITLDHKVSNGHNQKKKKRRKDEKEGERVGETGQRILSRFELVARFLQGIWLNPRFFRTCWIHVILTFLTEKVGCRYGVAGRRGGGPSEDEVVVMWLYHVVYHKFNKKKIL